MDKLKEHFGDKVETEMKFGVTDTQTESVMRSMIEGESDG